MKAKIKKTGEIVNIDKYISTVYLEQFDSYGNPISMCLDDVELIPDESHWQCVRERAAIAAMQAIIPTQKGEYMICDAHQRFNDCAVNAIYYADAIVEKLKKKS